MINIFLCMLSTCVMCVMSATPLEKIKVFHCLCRSSADFYLWCSNILLCILRTCVTCVMSATPLEKIKVFHCLCRSSADFCLWCSNILLCILRTCVTCVMSATPLEKIKVFHCLCRSSADFCLWCSNIPIYVAPTANVYNIKYGQKNDFARFDFVRLFQLFSNMGPKTICFVLFIDYATYIGQTNCILSHMAY